jgi:IS30 family transposase
MSHETIYRSLFVQARGVLKKKLAAHLRSAIDVRVYLCDPQSPWQRGTNENTNRPRRLWPSVPQQKYSTRVSRSYRA